MCIRDRLIFAQDFSIARIHYDGGGDWYGDPSSIPNLLNYVQKNTSATNYSRGLDLSSKWDPKEDLSVNFGYTFTKSYDGSTPWQAAMFGSEHDYLKTIVPISGLIGVKELMWRNGSAEARAPIMHNGVYGSYGFDGDEEDWIKDPFYYLDHKALLLLLIAQNDHRC